MGKLALPLLYRCRRVTSGHNLLIEQLLDEGSSLTRSEVFAAWEDALREATRNMPLPQGNANAPARRYPARLRLAITIGLRGYFDSRVLLKRSLKSALQEQEAERKRQDKEIEKLKNELAETKKRTAAADRNEQPQQPPKRAKKTFICRQWMKNSCRFGSTCRDAHAGDYNTMKFVNERFSMGLEEKALRELADDK